MQNDNSLIIGNKAEDYVKKVYEKMNYTFVKKNYRYNKSEIDLIFQKENTMVFVEVKARKTEDYGLPEEFASDQQRDRILEGAENFIIEKNWQKNIRFDIVAVTLKKEAFTHKIFYDAF